MKVSVIIPFHNAFSFLEKSVSSASNQDETGELILIDDHSTDNSLDLVKKLQQKDDRIIILQNNSNISGAAISRNVGVHHASHDYIAFLDADDYYLPERFTSDVLLFLNNPDDSAGGFREIHRADHRGLWYVPSRAGNLRCGGHQKGDGYQYRQPGGKQRVQHSQCSGRGFYDPAHPHTGRVFPQRFGDRLPGNDIHQHAPLVHDAKILHRDP